LDTINCRSKVREVSNKKTNLNFPAEGINLISSLTYPEQEAGILTRAGMRCSSLKIKRDSLQDLEDKQFSAVKVALERITVLNENLDRLSSQNEYVRHRMANISAEKDEFKRHYEATMLENNKLREQVVGLQSAVEAEKEQVRVLNEDVDCLLSEN
jgi:chromosome segregation ATPase